MDSRLTLLPNFQQLFAFQELRIQLFYWVRFTQRHMFRRLKWAIHDAKNAINSPAIQQSLNMCPMADLSLSILETDIFV